MLLPQARADVVRTCRDLRRARLVVGTAGNVSVRDGDLIAISPSGLDYDDLTPDLVGVHRLDGTPVEAPLAPSSEFPLHVAVYEKTSARAVVHTHGVASTAAATVLEVLPAAHYYVALFGGPVRVARYATYGTAELAANVVAALDGRTGALMAHHGAITVADTLRRAYSHAEYLEYLCDVQLRALATGLPVRVLPAEELDRVAEALGSYGQQPPAPAPG